MDGNPAPRTHRNRIAVSLRREQRVRQHIAHRDVFARAGHRPVKRVFALHHFHKLRQHIALPVFIADPRPCPPLFVDVHDRPGLNLSQRRGALARLAVHGHPLADGAVIRRPAVRRLRQTGAQRQQQHEPKRPCRNPCPLHQLARYTRTVSTPPTACSAKRTSYGSVFCSRRSMLPFPTAASISSGT